MRGLWGPGKLDNHIQELIACYKHKCNLLLEAIAQEFPSDMVVLRPDGGFFVWCKLPSDISSKSLLMAASEHGVSFFSARDSLLRQWTRG
ncbi:hypothetical protein [Nostoc sp.]|uniref:hypothetical protein n=1 Tax=Nostoc sp. TaxID=1180 RepID=UPI002FF78610